MAPRSSDTLRIFTPIGCVGYGYSTETFWKTLDTYDIDAIICDAGSTDSGPQKLALGHTTVPKESYEADLEPMVAAAHECRIPTIITSAGGDGSNEHVDLLVDQIDAIVARNQYRTLKVIKIYAEIPKPTVHDALQAGKIGPCGGGVPPLTSDDIDSASRIVAQMGVQPFLKAMRENPDFDIIIAGRTYDPAPYAAFCMYRGFNNIGVIYHMGKIMECGAQCAVPKSREALAVVSDDSFDVMPLDPGARCTSLSVAAHTLYEKSRPDYHYGPDGMLDLTQTQYTELPDSKSVRVSGSLFKASTPESKWTIKLEGARTNGYHSLFIGGFADPILISQLDEILPRIEAFAASKCPFDHSLKLTTYGRENAARIRKANDTTVSPNRPSRQGSQPATVGLLGQARASTQREANMVVAMARIACVHGPYKGQKATSGNFGMPTAPQEIEMGPISEFNIYHLVTIDNPVDPFPIEVHQAEGSGRCQVVDRSLGPGVRQTTSKRRNASLNSTQPSADGPEPFRFKGNQLGELASVIRAKNAGPYEVTFDAIFDSPAVYQAVKSSGVLTKAKIAETLQIDESDVIVAMWWDPALAFKATIVRPMVSGGFGEVDMHASTQHVPLMSLEIPLSTATALSTGANGFTSWCLKRRSGRLSLMLAALSVASLLWNGRMPISVRGMSSVAKK